MSPQTLAVLGALAGASDGWLYGLELAASTGLKSGSLYPILIRLAERELVEAKWIEPSSPGRPPRHGYRLLPAGRAMLRAAMTQRSRQTARELHMNGLTRTERWVMRTARAVAGRERRPWLDAMEAELWTLERGRIDWALGSLVASIKDRAQRERPLGTALLFVPALALLTMIPLGLVSVQLARAVGQPTLTTAPLLALAPLPAAALLGAWLRPRSPLTLGAAAFAIYQAIPVVGLPLMTGGATHGPWWWTPNLTAFGLLGPGALLTTLGLWCAGTWAGARWTRARRNKA